MLDTQSLLEIKTEEKELTKNSRTRVAFSVALVVLQFVLFVDFSFLDFLIHIPAIVGLVIVLRDQSQNVLEVERLKCASLMLFYGVVINACGLTTSVFLLIRNYENWTSQNGSQESATSPMSLSDYSTTKVVLIIYMVSEGLQILFMTLLILLNNVAIKLKDKLVSHMKSSISLSVIP